MKNEPRISFVIAVNGRNGHNVAQALDHFHSVLSFVCNVNELRAELVVVLWNAPNSKLVSLTDNRLSSNDYLSAKLITVPQEIHNTFRNSATIPFFEMIARNVGIRRARAPFVLATDLSAILSNELIAFLARKPLDPNIIYSLYCYSVEPKIPDMPLKEQLDWYSANALPTSAEDSGVKGKLGEVQLNSNIKRYFADIERRTIIPSLKSAKQLIRHSFARPSQFIHDSVCRNFALMHKDAWNMAQGYIELPVYSMYLGKLLLYMAGSCGIKQLVLPKSMPLYHIADSDKVVMGLPIEERLKVFRQMPWLDINLWGDLRRYYIDGGETLFLNSSDWGLAQHELPEQLLS